MLHSDLKSDDAVHCTCSFSPLKHKNPNNQITLSVALSSTYVCICERCNEFPQWCTDQNRIKFQIRTLVNFDSATLDIICHIIGLMCGQISSTTSPNGKCCVKFPTVVICANTTTRTSRLLWPTTVSDQEI